MPVGSLSASVALAAVLAGPGTAGAGQPTRGIVFRHLSVSDGLSDSRVHSLWQDLRGFLWIGTVDGLNRYDGVGFRVFRHRPDDPTSLGPGLPRAIIEDKDGQLWIALLGGGLSRYDPRSESFTHLRHDPADPKSLSTDLAETLARDEDGSIWVGTVGGGLNRVDPRTGEVTRYRHEPAHPESLAGDTIAAIVRDRSGVLWVGTSDGGLERLVPGPSGSSRFEHFRHDPKDVKSLSSDRVTSLHETADGSLWIGTWDGGLNRLDPGRTAFTRYAVEGRRSGGDRVHDVLQDHTGAIWIATWGGGVRRLHPATGRFEQFLPDAADPESLGHPNVNCMIQDRNGLLWIGTVGGGLNVVDLEAKPFTRYTVTGERPGGLSGKDIRSVIVERNGSIWASAAGEGLNHIDRDAGGVTRYRHDSADPNSLADDNVWALLQDRDGTVWVGTFGGGLDRFDPATGRFVHHRHRPGDPDSLSNDTVYAIHEDAAGRLWVATWDGLNLMDRRTGRFRVYRSPRAEQQHALFIEEDPSGALWLGMSQKLVRFDPGTGAFDVVIGDASHPDRPGVGLIWCLRRDRAGRTWLGTSLGLVELVFSGPGVAPRIRSIAPRPGLPEAAVASIEEADGELWLGTTQGLVRFDPEHETATRYDTTDGLADQNFNLATFRTPDGELFFAATGGLTSFRPERIRGDPNPPRVVFTGLQLSHRPVTVGADSILTQSVSMTDDIELPHDAPVLTLDFAALSFRAPQRNRFRYRLEGFDREWHETGSGENSATYTSLPPGRYRFRVLGSNSDGAWNEEGASLAIRVRPPWWGTWWFRLLAGLVAAGLLFAAHRRRVASVEARNKRLEGEAREREEAQQAIMRSERQLRLIADALPMMIAYVQADGRVRFSNLASEQWFGRPRSEIEGRRVEEILSPEVLGLVSEHIDMAQGGERTAFDFAVGADPETRRRIAATLVPHAEGERRILGFYAFAQDITDRVKTEEELHRQHDQLAHASRVLVLGELASALAHELNQPLTAVLSNAHAALRLQANARGVTLDEEVEETLRDIAQDAARAGEIIRRMRDLVQKGESRKAPLDVNQAIRGVEALIRAAALEDSVTVFVDLAPGLPLLIGDTIQVQQVVLNLVRNGMEAMRPLPKAERRMVVRSFPEGETVVVSVEDSGPPIAREVLDRLFVPFYSTKSNGLGMGLSISRSIIQAHGGAIEAQSSGERGLRVRFTLPLGGRGMVVGGSRMTA